MRNRNRHSLWGTAIALALVLAPTAVEAATGVTINQAIGQSDPTNASPVNFTVVFSEAVTGFTAADVSLVASTAGGTLVANVTPVNATTYTVSVTGMTTDGTVVAMIPAGAALDANNQPSTASTSTDNTVTYDVTAPSVSINQSGIQSDPTNAAPIQFTATFSEAVTGFTGADISFAGSTAGGTPSAVVAGGPVIYTVVVNGMTGSGTVVASIPAGAVADSAGNANAASASIDNTVTYDSVPPSVTINQGALQADPTQAGPIVFDVAFSEAVTGFNPGDVSLNGTTVGGALSIAVSGGGLNYTVSVTGMTGNGVVVASIPAARAFDAANNASLASTSTDNTVTFDNVPPSVTIEQAPAQVDPTHALPIFFRVTFSEPVTGFTASDVVLSGTIGSAAIQISGGPTEYLIEVGSISVSGTVVVSLPAGAVTDLAGNPSLASTSADNAVTYLGQLFIPTLAPALLAVLALLLAGVAGRAVAGRPR